MIMPDELNELKSYQNHKINNPFLRLLMKKTISLFKPSFRYRDGTYWLKEIPKNSVCAEIGVYMGDNSELILKIAKPKKLFLIDSWVAYDKIFTKLFNKEKQEKRYHFTKKGLKTILLFQSSGKNPLLQ